MKKLVLLLFVFVIQTNLHAWRYFPEGTKWTEIRLDTLKYNSWYSKVGDEWRPNFETIEYYVQGEYIDDRFNNKYSCIYTTGPEWADSLTLLIYLMPTPDDDWYGGITVAAFDDDGQLSWPFHGQMYPLSFEVGTQMSSLNILIAGATGGGWPWEWDEYGTVEEIKEGDFGGVRPLKYSDVNGIRFIQGIGVASWNDGECIFGPIRPYEILSDLGAVEDEQRHYRSMLVHFERGGEVLYDVWPEIERTATTTIDGLEYFLYLDSHEAEIVTGESCNGELVIPSEVYYEGDSLVVRNLFVYALANSHHLSKVSIPKTLVNITHGYPCDPDEDCPTGYGNPIIMNPFMECETLESIEVDAENPSLKSVDGVLFSQDGAGDYYYRLGNYRGTGLYCYPKGRQQEVYAIPETVEWIGGYAFSRNQYLTTLSIPSSMKHICYDALSGLSKLTDVYCMAEDVPVVWDDAFKDTPIASATLHVPAGSIDLYKTTSPWKDFGNIVALPNPVAFTAGQMATIVLPTEPEASRGKYYRLDRVEGNEIVFEQELQPRAHIPYIIVPGEDFCIELGTLDLNGLSRDTVSIDGVSFIGTYQKEEIKSKEGFYIDIIDATPDCALTDNKLKVGALRAFLQVHWDDPYSHGGTKAPAEKMQIVLHDHGTGLKTLSNSPLKGKNIYDLNGRIVNGKWSNSKLPHGIYIKDGRKTLKK